MSKMYSSRENTSLKMKGAGDSIKTLTVRSSERTPVPSSRKFTPTTNRDETVELKLKKVLEDIEAKQGNLKKAKSVAEITPTKSKPKRTKKHDIRSTAALHATPRCMIEEVKKTPSRRHNDERRLERFVYQRMLLFVWRRNKSRLAMVSESLRRRQDQISQLEQQIDCLKVLTQSECQKRNEAMSELLRVENVLQTTQVENENLQEEKNTLQSEVIDLKTMLHNLKIDMDNLKNDMNLKNKCLKHLETEIQKECLSIKNVKEENTMLINKINTQNTEIKLQEETLERLNSTIKTLESQMKNNESVKEQQIANFNRLSEEYLLEVNKNKSLRCELDDLHFVKNKMNRKILYLQEQLTDVKKECMAFSNENEFLKAELKDRPRWWKNIKDFVAVSWFLVQHGAYIMLPAL